MKKALKQILSVSCSMAMILGMDTTVSAKTTLVDSSNIGQRAVFEAQMKALQIGPQAQLMSTDSLTGLLPWYENTGTSIPEGYTPDYSQYNLLETAQVGDVIYEANGGYGISGHAAIVEGKIYDETADLWYIRLIESTAPGVVRGILEDTCVNDWDVELYRVNDATDEQKQAAVDFCVGELGATYNLDFAHDYSTGEDDWYCSELVWAAYYNQGIDIETTGLLNEPGITPRDIARSSAVTKIEFK